MKLFGAVAVAALVVAAVVTTFGRSSGVTPEKPDTAPAAPAAPTQSTSPGSKLDLDPGSVGPMGLNVRYLDDGEIKDLGVRDFPR